MNANILTAANYAVAAGVGVGAAALASNVAPESIRPDSDGERKAWMVAGGVGGSVAAMQVLPRVLPSQLDKTLNEFHKFDKATLHAIAHKDLPIEAVPGTMSKYLGFHTKIENLTAAAAGNGIGGGWATKGKFVAVAAVGAAAGVGLLAGGMAIADKVRGD
jgi:hypothetical protein